VSDHSPGERVNGPACPWCFSTTARILPCFVTPIKPDMCCMQAEPSSPAPASDKGVYVNLYSSICPRRALTGLPVLALLVSDRHRLWQKMKYKGRSPELRPVVQVPCPRV
jgi:hypothetical protein